MKIVFLTSDIIDGVMIGQRIVEAGNDLKAIIYERKKQTIKSRLKRLLFLLKGTIKFTSYEGIKKLKPDLTVMAVDNMNSDGVRSYLNGIDTDLMVVAGTRKLKRDIFGAARLGTINMHSGILPYYRGADSEFWALMKGEKDRIGVTIHFMDEDLDTGDILLQEKMDVSVGDDYRSLRMKNILLGARKVNEAIALIASGNYKRIKQDESIAATYKPFTKKDLKEYRRRQKAQIIKKQETITKQ